MKSRVAAVVAGVLVAFAVRASDKPPGYPHGAFNGTCEQCHTGDSWTPAVIAKDFKHAARFPLTGAHRTPNCRSCHASLDFQKAPTACADCHRDPHIGELGADCARCHTPRNFIDRSAQLDAHRLTRFPLTGAHVTTDCQECHLPAPQGQLQYVNTPVDCQACHLPQYQATTNPDHVAGGFPTDCVQCHTPTVWSRASFDHNATGFPLTGAHKTTPCASCHGTSFNPPPPTACYGCHQADYPSDHAAAGFPTTCQNCHNTTSWGNATFAHTATFPLTGAHATTPCQSCHASGYQGTPTACVACHQADYQSATSPNHVTGNLPTDCARCHSTTAFVPSTFNHATTVFPLTGQHVTTPCESCHASTGYNGGTPTACVGCHNAEYQNPANDPNHVAAGLSTDCASCHTTNGWPGARYTQHDSLYFRIYSGHHSGRWSNACSTCHTQSSNYAVFDCLGCHTDPGTTQHHSGVSGYQYNSQACYTCHRNA